MIQIRNFNLISSSKVCVELGARIRAQRLAKNITKQELASMAQCSLSSIHRAELTGQMTLDLLVRFAQVLHMTAGLESLFMTTPMSIDAIEMQATRPSRQRARPKASAKNSSL